jgi:carboxylesterase type B
VLTLHSYRLGAPGFLYSTEMKEAGYLANNGLRDQQTALLWLKRYIDGFGGNPDNITLMGESAGAVSTAVHLHSVQPLFRRAMLMSGSTLLERPAHMSSADMNYRKASEALGLVSLTAQERLKKLVDMDGQQLSRIFLERDIDPLVTIPLLDGDICPVEVDFKSVIDGSLILPGKHWCEAVMLGDCAFDVSDTPSVTAVSTDLTVL